MGATSRGTAGPLDGPSRDGLCRVEPPGPGGEVRDACGDLVGDDRQRLGVVVEPQLPQLVPPLIVPKDARRDKQALPAPQPDLEGPGAQRSWVVGAKDLGLSADLLETIDAVVAGPSGRVGDEGIRLRDVVRAEGPQQTLGVLRQGGLHGGGEGVGPTDEGLVAVASCAIHMAKPGASASGC
uniref:Uncharacterized protein n=1 Tax=Janibacter limosus TaxID=53458 RepID=A0AC61U4Y6_9MICO|nr:hypothetical protein [Janibacter limosus]